MPKTPPVVFSRGGDYARAWLASKLDRPRLATLYPPDLGEHLDLPRHFELFAALAG
jgi:hypothetical protein